MIGISFMTANYVARQLGYNMTQGWGQGDKASQNYFRPLKTFAVRFEEYLSDVSALGFDKIDIWTGVINPSWAKDDHISTANELLAQYHLEPISLAGGFGATIDEFEASCQLASGLNISILGGNTNVIYSDRNTAVGLLEKYDLKLGIENHPEKTPRELLTKIGDGGDGRIGAAVDTGWFGTHGYDAAKALEELKSHLFYVHLKDVKEAGGHETCRFGEGVVPIEACVKTLERIGYQGDLCIEHEPDLFDPTEDIQACYAMVKEWLAS